MLETGAVAPGWVGVLTVESVVSTSFPQGEEFRTLKEMSLVRNHNPIFPLSWTVFHIIEESSPLFGVAPENIYDRIIFITVSFSGHDAAYSNSIYKTHIYHSDAILFDRQFVSVLDSPRPGEDIVLNLAYFHDTTPLPAEGSPPAGEANEPPPAPDAGPPSPEPGTPPASAQTDTPD